MSSYLNIYARVRSDLYKIERIKDTEYHKQGDVILFDSYSRNCKIYRIVSDCINPVWADEEEKYSVLTKDGIDSCIIECQKAITSLRDSIDKYKSKREEYVKYLQGLPNVLSYEEFTKTATVEELKKMSNISTITNSKRISLEELNDVIDKPLENIMVPIVKNLVPELAKLKIAIFYTKEDFGFITSDNPCVWRSFEAHMRLFQSPGLNDDTINIILPISPTHCILLNKQIEGYIDIDTNPESIDQINTLIYEGAENCIISNQKGIKFR